MLKVSWLCMFGIRWLHLMNGRRCKPPCKVTRQLLPLTYFILLLAFWKLVINVNTIFFIFLSKSNSEIKPLTQFIEFNHFLIVFIAISLLLVFGDCFYTIYLTIYQFLRIEKVRKKNNLSSQSNYNCLIYKISYASVPHRSCSSAKTSKFFKKGCQEKQHFFKLTN